jgi:hypothetical protein
VLDAAGGGCGVTAAVVVARFGAVAVAGPAALFFFAGPVFLLLPSGVTVTCALSPPWSADRQAEATSTYCATADRSGTV